MEPKNRPKWAKPKLIVLTRGEEAEGVLLVCKIDNAGNTGNPVEGYNACGADDYHCLDICSVQSSS